MRGVRLLDEFGLRLDVLCVVGVFGEGEIIAAVLTGLVHHPFQPGLTVMHVSVTHQPDTSIMPGMLRGHAILSPLMEVCRSRVAECEEK